MAERIAEEILTEIRARISIVEVISAHVALRKAGRSYTGLCPFHSESTPSFSVNEEGGFFHCFGCGAGGNAFDHSRISVWIRDTPAKAIGIEEACHQEKRDSLVASGSG